VSPLSIGRRGVERGIGQPEQMGPDVLGQTDQFGHDGDREDLGQVADRVERAPLHQVGDELVGLGRDLHPQPAQRPRGQSLGEYRAQPVVLGRVAGQDGAAELLIHLVLVRDPG
jgi:hypothetical protein